MQMLLTLMYSQDPIMGNFLDYSELQYLAVSCKSIKPLNFLTICHVTIPDLNMLNLRKLIHVFFGGFLSFGNKNMKSVICI